MGTAVRLSARTHTHTHTPTWTRTLTLQYDSTHTHTHTLQYDSTHTNTHCSTTQHTQTHTHTAVRLSAHAHTHCSTTQRARARTHTHTHCSTTQHTPHCPLACSYLLTLVTACPILYVQAVRLYRYIDWGMTEVKICQNYALLTVLIQQQVTVVMKSCTADGTDIATSDSCYEQLHCWRYWYSNKWQLLWRAALLTVLI
jgi:hypothetical protein